ncbi:tryptophan synthase subunit alpha [Salinicoccus halodurans]|uniref:Tryptophan synthase alpha chain n=1 Tax=Salinicoccus halodurans TaxID=407035 RepID=A0A0F7D3Z0_9STAP|nr:tryptophan synthase subunit alpha [Salinicoccus halodurans]AKG73320.1 tryptophan synthase subunit alpha [Salinicoccus halodurans]SFK82473.1 tryptophan synthase, alpha chain [Salinicoccus halodurans]
MSKFLIEETFSALKEKDEKAFIAYIMAGDGGLSELKNQILTLEASGVSIVELGIPFSDPVADGPSIQAAGQRALARGVTLEAVLEELARIKSEISIPVVIMTYANPVLRLGPDKFADLAHAAGVSGVILPDVPLEQEDEFGAPLAKYDIVNIRFVTLTSSGERIREVTGEAEGFVYAVTVNGTTGAREGFDETLYGHLEHITEVSNAPVCAGFGIGTREQAEAVGAACDGVIVGSRIVNLLHEGKAEEIKGIIPRKSAAGSQSSKNI